MSTTHYVVKVRRGYYRGRSEDQGTQESEKLSLSGDTSPVLKNKPVDVTRGDGLPGSRNSLCEK